MFYFWIKILWNRKAIFIYVNKEEKIVRVKLEVERIV